jgi:hypothetical protein
MKREGHLGGCYSRAPTAMPQTLFSALPATTAASSSPGSGFCCAASCSLYCRRRNTASVQIALLTGEASAGVTFQLVMRAAHEGESQPIMAQAKGRPIGLGTPKSRLALDTLFFSPFALVNTLSMSKSAAPAHRIIPP